LADRKGYDKCCDTGGSDTVVWLTGRAMISAVTLVALTLLVG